MVDGEHYPPVVSAALEGLRPRYEIVAGLFAGGREKLRGDASVVPGLATELGLPWLDDLELEGTPHMVLKTARATLRAAHADALVDLSDEPVIGYRERFLLMSAALAEGARYVAADAELRPRASHGSRPCRRWA